MEIMADVFCLLIAVHQILRQLEALTGGCQPAAAHDDDAAAAQDDTAAAQDDTAVARQEALASAGHQAAVGDLQNDLLLNLPLDVTLVEPDVSPARGARPVCPPSSTPPQVNSDEDSQAVQSDTVQSDPVQSGPVQSGPVQSGPVQSDPVQSDPVQSGPVQSGPVQSGPVQSDPVQSDPVQSGPVQSGPPRPSLFSGMELVTTARRCREPPALDGGSRQEAAAQEVPPVCNNVNQTVSAFSFLNF